MQHYCSAEGSDYYILNDETELKGSLFMKIDLVEGLCSRSNAMASVG